MESSNKSPPADPAIPDLRALRVLALLERITASNQPVSVSQLAQRVNIPKATLVRLLEILVTHGYVLNVPGMNGYIPGPQATRLATQTLGNNTFRHYCRTILGALVQLLGETCNLTVLDGDNVMYIERIETDEPLRMHIAPGTRLPLHCTAGGKLFLSRLNQPGRLAVLQRLHLKPMTPSTLTEPRTLGLELDRLAALGIGLDNEEFVRGMVGIAVPVCLNDGTMVAALVCHSATARTSLPDLLLHRQRLELAARQMGTLFGAAGSLPTPAELHR